MAASMVRGGHRGLTMVVAAGRSPLLLLMLLPDLPRTMALAKVCMCWVISGLFGYLL